MLVAKGIADFTPLVKESYSLTFFIKATIKIIKNNDGISTSDILFSFDKNFN